jgi:orotate phosphoribosyltransferase
MNSIDTGKKVASMLLDIEAIKLSPDTPYTWSSGWKSPIYCDNRLLLSYPEVRNYIEANLKQLVEEKFPSAQSIAGVATAGVPHGAIIAHELSKPFVYVRSKAKGHGMENLIEGKITPGQKVVVVEDLISTGGSSLKAAQALTEAGFEVLGMIAIFTYGFNVAKDNFEQAKLPLHCLCDYNILLDEALNKGKINQKHLESLNSWRGAPDKWKQ